MLWEQEILLVAYVPSKGKTCVQNIFYVSRVLKRCAQANMYFRVSMETSYVGLKLTVWQVRIRCESTQLRGNVAGSNSMLNRFESWKN